MLKEIPGILEIKSAVEGNLILSPALEKTVSEYFFVLSELVRPCVVSISTVPFPVLYVFFTFPPLNNSYWITNSCSA